MIDINLLPPELRKKDPIKIALPAIPIRKTLIFVLPIFFGVQICFLVFALSQKVELANFKKQVDTLKTSLKTVSIHQKETDAFKIKFRQTEALTERKFYWTVLLNALSDSVTKGVWLRGFSVGDDQAMLMTTGQKKDTAAPSPPAPKKADPIVNKGGKKDASASDNSSTLPSAKEEVKPQTTNYLKLEGSVVAPGQETAFIGYFIKELKDNPLFGGLFDGIALSNISQKKVKEVDVYDFVLLCVFKKGKI